MEDSNKPQPPTTEPTPTHEEYCADPHERFGPHEPCDASLSEHKQRLLIAASDMHSRVSTLFSWGLSHEEATALMEEAYEIFTIENSERILTHKPPRAGTSVPRLENKPVPTPTPEGLPLADGG